MQINSKKIKNFPICRMLSSLTLETSLHLPTELQRERDFKKSFRPFCMKSAHRLQRFSPAITMLICLREFPLLH